MILLAMLALSWAFTTYFALPVTALVVIVLLDLVWFVLGFKTGRGYEKDQLETKEVGTEGAI